MSAPKKDSVTDLVTKLEAAAYAYHNGLAETMTDAEYDAAIERLETLAPDHPFLKRIGASLPASLAAEEVALPVPLPSLNKAKPGTLAKWLSRHPAAAYQISTKLDGCSALWLPETRQFFTRGDGLRGRNISAFAPYIQGLPLPPAPSSSASAAVTVYAVRGEIIMRTDSPAIPAGKLARNIVAGALNRKEPDPTLFAQLRFVAYELLHPANETPTQSYRIMRTAGYEVARSTTIAAADMTEAKLSDVFGKAEATSPYQLDGIVVAPDLARHGSLSVAAASIKSENPEDRVAWKTRPAGLQATQRTKVLEVEWNVSHGGHLIPRVLFEPVALAGATISAATGLHGRWIHDNKVGPGAIVEIRRAGDTIPQIIAVHSPAPSGPSMPPSYQWLGDPGSAVHIGPVAGNVALEAESNKIKLTHALGELGAENVGPGIVAKLYDAGFTTVGSVYAGSPAEFEAKLDGVKGKSAQRIYEGLRAAQSSWTTLNFLTASSTMPRGVGKTKLAPLLAMQPDVTAWTSAALSPRPAGLSDKTIDAIIASVPAFLAWLAETGFHAAAAAAAPSNSAAAAAAPVDAMTVVFTGARDKALEAELLAKGHTVAASVTKKTTHVVYPDSSAPTSSKIDAAKAAGIPILTMTAFRTLLV
jgi:DNA ligase (NAD+)